MIRLHFVVEGQTEETFVNQTLAPHLAHMSIVSDARCVATSRKDNVKHRGGVNNYEQVKNDIVRWMRGDRNSDARFTTMLDLYALPPSFPGYESASRLQDPRQRVEALESALKEDIGDWRFIPYIHGGIHMKEQPKIGIGCAVCILIMITIVVFGFMGACSLILLGV